ncbi:MAG: response regulator [Nitrospirae bacterium]|nr:response regulator [Nitrospirota bacterium]
MVIQSSFASRNVIIYILRQTGFKAIYSARDGGDALKELATGEYGMIVTDWHMADMDALELLRSVREDPALKEMVFIVVTADSDREKVMEAKEHGVDGYLTKPFTAESLSNKIFEALRTRQPGGAKPARQHRAKTVASGSKNLSSGISREPSGTAAGSGQSWSIPMSQMHRGSKSVIKHDFAAMMNVMSLKLDRMKADPVFVSVKEIVSNVTSTIKTAERQSEHAIQITKTTAEISKVLTVAESAPPGSPESIAGLGLVEQSASKLADMIDSFDQDVDEIVNMLNSMDHMVRQVHLNAINESIKDAYALEKNQGTGITPGEKADLSESSGKVVEGLSKIRFESETARESLTTAAGGISHVIERIKAQGPAAQHSYELFEQLTGRIDRMMDMLESQISLTEKIESGMKEATVVREKIRRREEPNEDEPEDKAVSSPKTAGTPNVTAKAPAEGDAALRRIWEYRILMINIIKKEHLFSMKDFGEMKNGTADMLEEHLPGHSSGSFSKWLDHSLLQQDYYDPALCRQIALYRDAMHSSSVKAVALLRKGSKDEALKDYKKVGVLSGQIVELLDKLQDSLRKKV